MKSILILGAGVMQIPAIRIARRKGWRVILADGNPTADARSEGDHFEHIDLKDRAALADMAGRCKRTTGLDGVFTAGTDFSASVAWVAEAVGLPGIPYEVALRATDKCLMREAFASHGVPSPPFACWTGEGNPRDLLGEALACPLVVKPVDNMGARGVRRVDSHEDLEEACRDALALSRSGRVIVERFMDGIELSLDAIIWKGRAIVCGIADRHIHFPPNFVEMGHTMPTSQDGQTTRAIEEVFKTGIAALGIDSGAAKGDLKLTSSGPMVGEIAARLSGGYMSGWTYPLSSGVEVTEAALNIAVGLPPGDLTPSRRRTCVERAWISVPGTVAEILGRSDAKAVPGVEHLFLRIAAGDAVVFPTNNVTKAGNVITVADTRAEAIAAANRALAALCIRLQPCVEATTDHLFRAPAHAAFPDVPPRLERLLATMPPFVGDPSRLDPVIGILPLSGEIPDSTVDWYGMGLRDAARRAALVARAQLVEPGGKEGFLLGALFWRAVIRGSVTGGIYIIDSIRDAARRGAAREFMAGL